MLLIPALAGLWGWQRQGGHQRFVACHPRQKDDLTRQRAIEEITQHPAIASACVHMGVYIHTLTYTQHTPTCVCHTARLYPFQQFLKSMIPTKDVWNKDNNANMISNNDKVSHSPTKLMGQSLLTLIQKKMQIMEKKIWNTDLYPRPLTVNVNLNLYFCVLTK